VIVQKVTRETLRMKRMKLRNSSSAAATEREKVHNTLENY